MYRSLALISVLLFALTACGNNETPKVTHDASLSKALTQSNSTPATETVVKCPVTNTECNSVAVECPVSTEQECPKAVTPEIAAQPAVTEMEPATTSILTLSLPNNFGAVFVPHSLHVAMYNCDLCHTTNPPSKINKSKKEFHALCRKCHIDLQTGPIKCRACHDRK